MKQINRAQAGLRRFASSIVFGAGIALAIFAMAGASPNENSFHPAVGEHVTRGDSDASTELLSPRDFPEQAEVVSPEMSPPTRSSFMAHWQSVSGAIGYRLDVSTDSSFSSYVEGYENVDVGNVTGRVVTGLSRGTTYYYRVRAYDGTSTSASSEVTSAATTSTAGLVIHAVFDKSITTNPNAAAIEAMINRAILIYESLFSDPVSIAIYFRYATTQPDGTPIPGGVAQSRFVVYSIPWYTYLNALRSDAKTSYDNTADASLPPSALSAYIKPASASGRALRLNTPPAMFANGTVASGGPFDGIVTLNSANPFKFSRPASSGYYDAQRATEHEIDEVLGLGSKLNSTGADLRPQDLFSWSSAGARSLSTAGMRYFSINRGTTNIVNFNQNSTGDFGDWLSTVCPQARPDVQNAFLCTGQSSDISARSAEGINLDVIGYDLVGAPLVATDFNKDSKPDYLLFNASTRQTTIWYLNNHALIAAAAGPTLPAGWRVADVADFNRDGYPDYALFNPGTLQTVIWYLSGATLISGGSGPTLPGGWQLVATADFNGDGKPDYVLYNTNTRQTVLWYMSNNTRIGSATGPTLPAGWSLVGIADFNGDAKADYLLFNAATRQTVVWYLSGATYIGAHAGPTISSGYQLAGTSDFNGDFKPDYLLYNPTTRQTAIWYLSNFALSGAAAGPTLPAGWTLAAP